MIGATFFPSGGGPDRSIFNHIVSAENLFAAWRVFKKGKTRKPDVIEFAHNLENNIFALRDELLAHNWKCGGYKKFSIKDPKPRTIHKATVRDRILYQAVYQILYPIFDKTFIFDSYSSRKDKGTHAGIKRLNIFLRKLNINYTKPVYALKCDIKKYFDSIDHEILISLIKNKVECLKTLALIEKIINSFHKTSGKGLPLGNVTSQVFANIYMNGFDWYVKNELGIKHYIRYNDDFIILSSNKNELIKLIRYIVYFLLNNLKLELHPDKIIIRKLHQGVDFLGAVLLPHRMAPRTKTKRRIIKKSLKMLKELEAGKITKEKFGQSTVSYLGHLSHTKSRVVQHLLHSIRAKMWNLPE
ncbi:MAG: hypothetical protein HYT69_01410 [Candidatus Zambryskibacteria bacterium]|nr:hypothetical protein [Candidatus Zambryskibacteria bacterium]